MRRRRRRASPARRFAPCDGAAVAHGVLRGPARPARQWLRGRLTSALKAPSTSGCAGRAGGCRVDPPRPTAPRRPLATHPRPSPGVHLPWSTRQPPRPHQL
eukprot:scaffold1640_cov111-Isochrysis_galbana.AAC.23